MIPLILSITSSSIIFVIFKFFDRFKIDTFQAIVMNYFTAFTIGFVLYGSQWDSIHLQQTSWIPFAIVCSFLFIGLFLVMGKSAQINGVASTSIAVKMSMAISLLIMILAYNETVSLLKIAGISMAFLGVYLITAKSKGISASQTAVWMLLVLFFGSGALDFVLNYAQNEILGTLSPALFSAIGFGMAGTIGLMILSVQIARKKAVIRFKNILAGIILGIPNYFSIYLLLESYRSTNLPDSTVLAITNVSVVLLSALLGFLAFREKATQKKMIGLIASILAIVILYLANKNG